MLAPEAGYHNTNSLTLWNYVIVKSRENCGNEAMALGG